MILVDSLNNIPFQLYAVLIARLLLAGVLGGIIGFERESTHRPAGFRTHILVCVGSALVMVTSEFIFERYKGAVNIDPARLGAQVISGIGFLGAGTIIREGFNVKGLTTAASLWAVSCVGLAAGIGFYEGAIAATVLIYVTLILLKKWEDYFSRKEHYKVFYIESVNMPGLICSLSGILEENGISIKSIEFMHKENDADVIVKFLTIVPKNFKGESIVDIFHDIRGIKKVYEG